ncbi:MAG: septum site-determining protein MinC [Rhodospirillales bacterium]|nr:septum site-determining protein MinC [Rhodospirillales bacterium]
MTSAATVTELPKGGRRHVDLRGASFTLLVLRMTDPKDDTLYAALADRVAQAPSFFRHAPVVVDLSALAEAPPINIAEVGRRLRQHGLVPVGVQNATAEQNKAAVNAGFSVLREGSQAPISLDDDGVASGIELRVVAPPAADRPPIGTQTKVVTQPVRSGQQVYAQGGDLVVLASTSPGAELLADGHIHVYGALKGRALAGVSGDQSSRIFCHKLDADLVSIAGTWQVREDLPEEHIGKPVQISLEGDRVVFQPLS